MFRHLGRTGGAGAGAGGGPLAADDDCDVGTLEIICVSLGAKHFVQTVEVRVLRTVDTVWVTRILSLVPDLIVSVTGHVVRVVRILEMPRQLKSKMEGSELLTSEW